jgi:hypothetical protein
MEDWQLLLLLAGTIFFGLIGGCSLTAGIVLLVMKELKRK